MEQDALRKVNKVVDSIQQRLSDYAFELRYDALPLETIHAAKVRLIDTLGGVIGGFFGEHLLIARNLAARIRDPQGATIIGTRIKTPPDMAAFVNASNAHHVETQDIYQHPGSCEGHPSDTIMPVLAAAEHAQASGQTLIVNIVLAYEIFCRMCDVFHEEAFDYTNFACLGTAIASGKILGLSRDSLAHCIAMAVVPNVSLRQEKSQCLSVWKEMASGQAGRAGLFAALLARAGMEGPHLPFEGKAGWSDHVARERFSLDTLGGDGVRFKIVDTYVKNRPAAASAISVILAAEKVAPRVDIKDIKAVMIEAHYGRYYENQPSKQYAGMGDRFWHPETRGNANHSFPYVAAATLMDGTVTVQSFDDAHLRNPQLRALIAKTDVAINKEFNKAFLRVPQQHHARVTVLTLNGDRLVGEAGGDPDDLSGPRDDSQVEQKFRGLTEEYLGAKRATAILDRLWHLEEMADTREIPPALVIV